MSDNTKPKQHSLTTLEATVQPGRATLETPVSPCSFSIAAMMAGDNELRFAALRAETPAVRTERPGILRRLWHWWAGSPDAAVRLIYSAEAPSEDPNEEPGEPQEFDDFMLSLIRGGAMFYASAEGTLAQVDASEQDEEDKVQLPTVQAGERLLLDVLNPTNEPITAKVTFRGPELDE